MLQTFILYYYKKNYFYSILFYLFIYLFIFLVVALYLPPYSSNIPGGMPLLSRNLQYVPDLGEFSDGRKNKHINKTNPPQGQMSNFCQISVQTDVCTVNTVTLLEIYE